MAEQESRFSKRYAREFRLQAARLVVEGGYSYKQAAERLGTTSWSIRQWVKKFRRSGELPSADQPVPQADELRKLRKEVSELRIENEILKKAMNGSCVLAGRTITGSTAS
jgi:transposase-like protein